MKKMEKNKMIKYLAEAVLFSVCYAAIELIHQGYVEGITFLGRIVVFFVLNCLIGYIAPKLRRLLGFDMEGDKE